MCYFLSFWSDFVNIDTSVLNLEAWSVHPAVLVWFTETNLIHALEYEHTLSLFDPAFFTWVVSLAVTFNQPNSNASLSQKRYPYHCPTHECCREKPIDCTICSLWTLYHQPSTVFTAHLWETMWCDRFHNAATCRLSPGVDLRLHTLAQLFLDVLKKLQLHYCI